MDTWIKPRVLTADCLGLIRRSIVRDQEYKIGKGLRDKGIKRLGEKPISVIAWKETRRGNTEIDRAVKCALRESGEEHELWGYNPFGFDERQFSSPGFNLPIGCLFRTYSHRYPENHTSADDLKLMSPEKLGGALALLARVLTA